MKFSCSKIWDILALSRCSRTFQLRATTWSLWNSAKVGTYSTTLENAANWMSQQQKSFLNKLYLDCSTSTQRTLCTETLSWKIFCWTTAAKSKFAILEFQNYSKTKMSSYSKAVVPQHIWLLKLSGEIHQRPQKVKLKSIVGKGTRSNVISGQLELSCTRCCTDNYL